MEKRVLKVSYAKAGNGKGAKLSLPVKLLRLIDISEDEREIDLSYDEEKKVLIIAKKK